MCTGFVEGLLQNALRDGGHLCVRVLSIGLSEHLLLWGLVLNFAHLGMLGLPW